MFRGDWRTATAYILIVLLCFGGVQYGIYKELASAAKQRAGYEQSSKAHVDYAQDAIDRECLSLVGKPLRDCIHDKIAAARDHERANQDLDAQKEMAKFTRVMGYTAVVGLVLGAVSVVAIFLTLKATQDMARETSRIGEAQVRAYISFKPEYINIGIPSDLFSENGWSNQPTEVTIIGELVNSGQSPARRVTCSFDIQAVRPGDIFEADARKLNGRTQPSAGIIPAGESMKQSFKNVFDVDWRALADREVLIYFVFGIRFEDAFGKIIDTPLAAGHIDGAADLVKSRLNGEDCSSSANLRFIWDVIEAETTYEY